MSSGGESRTSLRVMIVAGEASGDRHAARLVDALRERVADLEVFGSGGDELAARGADVLVHARDVAIMGVPEVIRGFGRLWKAFQTLRKAATERRPSVVVLVDWPEFNLRLARKLKREGHRIVYYVSPQVWAWREYRVNQIRRDVDRMLVIFPFEEEFYRKHGVDAVFVGHPLVGDVAPAATREEFFRAHGLKPGQELVALLPGSRRKEISLILPVLSGVVEILKRSRPGLQFVLPLASTASREHVEPLMEAVAGDVRIVERDTYSAVGHADLAIVASGTATLETALLGTPQIVVYKVSAVNYRIFMPLIKVDTFGMVNLIAGMRIAPELFQDDCTPERVAAEALSFLEAPERLSAMRAELGRVRGLLGESGSDASGRAAEEVLRFTDRLG
ncbi:MAG: lipid-A-disaccharide synthase [Acidobacteria bacterium]|nr:lipid-A-disaccharide synthase [Acidobacteriota bacterium]